MNYQKTLDFLFDQLPMFQRIGAAAYKNNLDNTYALCNILDNPQNRFKSIHIAGTNGKGSVSHLIASILQEQNYRVGLFTSPHLKDFRERIRINGQKIPEDQVVGFVKTNANKFKNIRPSFFEYTFGMAIDYFAREKVDFAIMETGMGGRLDSTNVVDPVLSVITNIGYDHMQFLGTTLREIAAEKVGIIKNEIPVVVGESQDEVIEIIENRAKECGSVLQFADQNYSIIDYRIPEYDSPMLELDVRKISENYYRKYRCPLSGSYQKKNILTALTIVDSLRMQGHKIDEDCVNNGILKVDSNTGISGRWQILRNEPLTICDTGHNIDGIREIVSQIAKIPYEKLHFILGMVEDKNIEGVLKLLPNHAEYYFCKANIPRGMDKEKLKEHAKSFGLIGNSFDTVSLAYSKANEVAGNQDLIFIGGSTFVVAEVL